MGRNGTDTNAVDFFNDGSGSGNCFSGNSSSTFDPSDTRHERLALPALPGAAAAGLGDRAPSDGRPRSVRRPGRLRDHRAAGEPGVLVDQASAPAVRGLHAARRHPGADLSVSGRALTACALAAAAIPAVAVPASSGAPEEARQDDRRSRSPTTTSRPPTLKIKQGIEGEVGLVGREPRHPQRRAHQRSSEEGQEERLPVVVGRRSGSSSSASSRCPGTTGSSARSTGA